MGKSAAMSKIDAKSNPKSIPICYHASSRLIFEKPGTNMMPLLLTFRYDTVMADMKFCPFCGSKAKIDKPSPGAPGFQVFWYAVSGRRHECFSVRR
jgi:hypothetical protein